MAMRPLRPTRTHLSGGGCRGDAPRRPYLPRARMYVIDGLGACAWGEPCQNSDGRKRQGERAALGVQRQTSRGFKLGTIVPLHVR